MSSFGWTLISSLMLCISAIVVLDLVLPPRLSLLKKILNMFRRLAFWNTYKKLLELEEENKMLKQSKAFWMSNSEAWKEMYNALSEKHKATKQAANQELPSLSSYGSKP